jgi:membrane protease YdiL (CAAX protease family)
MTAKERWLSAEVARRPGQPISLWAYLMMAGLLVIAVALAILLWLRIVDPAGLTAINRAILRVAFISGVAVFTVGLAIPMGLMVSRAGTVGGAALGSHRVVLGTTLLVILISNIPPTIYGLSTSIMNLQTLQGFLIAAFSVEVTLIGATYLRLIGSGLTTWRDLGFDWRRIGPDIGKGLGYGLLAFLISALLQSLLDLVGVRQTQIHELAWIRDLDLAGFAAVFLVGAIGAPVAEELYFRGYVFAAYLRQKGPLVAYVLSGVVFATLHLNLEALLPIFVLGLVFAWMYRRSGSVIPPITAHALNNGLAFLIFYFGPSSLS